jgi:hypothetical protein
LIKSEAIKATPWDAAAFGLPTYELFDYSAEVLEQSVQTAGHYTLKVDPLSDKRLLHEYGFYYCDTLIEPFCTADKLRASTHSNAGISREFDSNRLISICQASFTYGRFHRDFNLPTARANMRYSNWLAQLINEQQVYGLYWKNDLAGFICHRDSSLVLHALDEGYRGKGFSKYWWSAVCLELLSNGHASVQSSISVTNLPVLNLYVSLGFSFKSPKDIYHRLVP